MDNIAAMRKRNHSQSSETPRGKKRKLRDYAEKLARVPREEARPEQNEQATLYFEGKCTADSCEKEQACLPKNETHNYCRCTSNGMAATWDSKCPRSTGEPIKLTVIGKCTPDSCGMEQACFAKNETHNYCRCVSNGMVATRDTKCPRITSDPAKLAIVDHKSTDEPIKFTLVGKCTPDLCGMEQACFPKNETHNYCRCVSNGMVATRDTKCPRITSDPAKLAIVDHKSTSEPIKFTLVGKCTPDSCGMEQACFPKNETHNYCRCTSNGMVAKKDTKCPRSTVPGLFSKPIRGVIPPLPRSLNASVDRYALSTPTGQVSKSLVSSEIFSESTPGTDTHVVGAGVDSTTGILLMAIAGGAALLFIVVISIIWFLRRRICTIDGKAQPRVRPGEPLLAERYITNPQYGVYGNSPAAQPTDDTNEPQVPLLDRHALTFLEEVGEGCFGKVHKGLLRASNGEQVVAIKVLKESASRSAEEDFVREVSIMSAFRHDNILTLVGVVYREDISASPWMVFEYMEWGDLAGVLRGSRGGGRPGPSLDEPALLHVALQVARGMQYLASRRFVHRDLAARNCLVGANLAVKIADFGMSRDVYTCDYYKMGGERPMPVRWMSPESIVYARFTHESDVWSYGVVLWEIYSRGKQPFYGHNNDGATRLILQGIVLVPPEECPRFACELMRACWQSDPRDRINFEEICRKLEVAAGAQVQPVQTGLPRPPLSPTPQDSAGYLIPARQTPVDYLTLSLPEPEAEESSESSEEEEDEDYT